MNIPHPLAWENKNPPRNVQRNVEEHLRCLVLKEKTLIRVSKLDASVIASLGLAQITHAQRLTVITMIYTDLPVSVKVSNIDLNHRFTVVDIKSSSTVLDLSFFIYFEKVTGIGLHSESTLLQNILESR